MMEGLLVQEALSNQSVFSTWCGDMFFYLGFNFNLASPM